MDIPINDAPILHSMEQARAVKSELVDQLQRLQAELSSRNVTTSGGRRADGPFYFQWRQRKIEEMTRITRQIRYAKEWIMRHSNIAQKKNEEEKQPFFSVNARIEALECLYLRVKAYYDMQQEPGIEMDRLDEQWNAVVLSIKNVDNNTQVQA